MYLIRLYARSKIAACIILLLIVIQLSVSFKILPQFFPFLRYSMYSYPEHKGYAPAYTVIVNGKSLSPLNFTPHFYDQIIQPIIYSEKAEVYDHLSVLPHKVKSLRDISDKVFTRITPDNRKQFHLRRLERMLNVKIKTFNVVKSTLRFSQGKILTGRQYVIL